MQGFDIRSAHAKAPLSNQQAPYFYRFNYGKMQVSVVSDGPLPLGDPSGAFLGTTKEDIGDAHRQLSQSIRSAIRSS